METGLVAYLKAHAGLNALIGGRIYPLRLPEKYTLPAVVYQRATTMRDVVHDGPCELANARFQFDVWADTYAKAKEVAAVLRQALLGYAGSMGSKQVWVTGQETEINLYEADTGLYRVSMDFRIHHN